MTTSESNPNNCGTTDPQVSLTRRERDILRLLAQGLSNKEIAAQLHLSEKTIKNHVSEILSKLGLHNRTPAALWAVEHGLGDRERGQLENPGAK